MLKNRLAATMLAAVFFMNCTLNCWAEDGATKPPEPDGGAVAGAAVSDIIFVPGKVITCVTGGVVWFIAMTVSLGAVYRGAADIVHDACSGKWVIRGEDMVKPVKDEI